MKPRHTVTSPALLALAVFMTSLVMMLDVLSQGQALAAAEIDAQSINFSKKPVSPDDDGLGEVDRMQAGINGVLERINTSDIPTLTMTAEETLAGEFSVNRNEVITFALIALSEG